MNLKTYKAKRTFEDTPEPKGKVAKKSRSSLQFCVQKHAATRLHYDFRLEHKGVLLSWAIPKGPSLNPSEKHLAIQVEDHPYDYKDFEGTIPKGNYGAGTVMLWDKGTYTPTNSPEAKTAEKQVEEGLKKGHLSFILHGEKLKGEFHLVRINQAENSWLFFKKKDPYSSQDDVTQLDYSVKTRRSMDEIAKGKTSEARKKVQKKKS